MFCNLVCLSWGDRRVGIVESINWDVLCIITSAWPERASESAFGGLSLRWSCKGFSGGQYRAAAEMDRFLCADMLKDDCTCVLEGKLPQLSIWKAVSQLNWELGITFLSACTRMSFSPFFFLYDSNRVLDFLWPDRSVLWSVTRIQFRFGEWPGCMYVDKHRHVKNVLRYFRKNVKRWC